MERAMYYPEAQLYRTEDIVTFIKSQNLKLNTKTEGMLKWYKACYYILPVKEYVQHLAYTCKLVNAIINNNKPLPFEDLKDFLNICICNLDLLDYKDEAK